ncbi:uncharacterized protein LOC117890973 [Drosophila subobscura]|uniref:uncharacterized protein LOC117890973 n=1 Tax=Drosophila subobscura TaxID=7241 RepID=UPI00155B228F|nr:uncharacterized protein LOC117890973 [Drosophila subobscura]XP_034652015.1 uncharacterized protein LOC117890973 [Drosophila subobscura]
MKRVTALFRPALGTVSFLARGAPAAQQLCLQRCASQKVQQRFRDLNKEAQRKNRTSGSGSLLLRNSHMRDANANAHKSQLPNPSDTARKIPHTTLATAKAVKKAPVKRMKTPKIEDYSRYRNSIREGNMWRDPAHPDTNWLKPHNAFAYKPDFGNTEPHTLKVSFMRSPDEKSKDMANRDLAKAMQKMRFLPGPAPMSATAKVVRQANPFENKFTRRTFMRSAFEFFNQKK